MDPQDFTTLMFKIAIFCGYVLLILFVGDYSTERWNESFNDFKQEIIEGCKE